ncbi:MAG TPA: hypothetical protein VN718_02690 [Rhizomicrobium sp.]|nr:hypothetical protein [Rhizomicrobium sp.]
MAKKTKRTAKKQAKKKSRTAAKSRKAIRKTKKTAKRAISKKRAATKKPSARKPVRKARRQPVPMPEQLAPSGVPELAPSALEHE